MDRFLYSNVQLASNPDHMGSSLTAVLLSTNLPVSFINYTSVIQKKGKKVKTNKDKEIYTSA